MIQISNRSDFISTASDVVLVIAIVLNILAMFLETFASLSAYMRLCFMESRRLRLSFSA